MSTEPVSGSEAPLVSVAITTFNSARWLPRALDSVLSQRVNFPLEVVIGDDCSEDDTVQVAKRYRDSHPLLITVVERPQNIGIQRNYYDVFERCSGKYIAWLDADDYWTDPEKLAVQTQVFESNPSVNACSHFVRWVFNDGKVIKDRWPSVPAGTYGLERILRSSFLPSPSVMFRNGLHRQLPDWYFDLAPVTDMPIWILAARSGTIVMLDKVMADYVHTPGSVATSKGQIYSYELDARLYEKVESILPAEWHRLVRDEKGKRYETIAYWLRQQGEFVASRQTALKAFRAPFPLDRVGSKTKALLAAWVHELRWRIRGGVGSHRDANSSTTER